MKLPKINAKRGTMVSRLSLALAGACVLTGAGIAIQPSSQPIIGPRAAQAQEFAEKRVYRVCARDLTVFNDAMQPIGTLYHDEFFTAERYSDGGSNDGVRRWAIGRAHGRALPAQGLHGRVLLQYLR